MPVHTRKTAHCLPGTERSGCYCEDSSCVRQRYSVALEIDALEQIQPIDLEVADGDEPTSLTAVLRGVALK